MAALEGRCYRFGSRSDQQRVGGLRPVPPAVDPLGEACGRLPLAGKRARLGGRRGSLRSPSLRDDSPRTAGALEGVGDELGLKVTGVALRASADDDELRHLADRSRCPERVVDLAHVGPLRRLYQAVTGAAKPGSGPSKCHRGMRLSREHPDARVVALVGKQRGQQDALVGTDPRVAGSGDCRHERAAMQRRRTGSPERFG